MITISRSNKNTNERMKEPRINEQIRARECMLIGEDGSQLGVVDIQEALDRADETGLDLVEVSNSADPIVCRIMDYGKYKYERQKKDKANKKNSKQQSQKEMKFRCNIGDSDYETKKKHINRFIDHGDIVKITIMFRGRELSHSQIGLEILDRLLADLDGKVSVLSAPNLEGRNMTMVIAPLSKQ